ncbi:MAG: hypothetical protein ACMUIP_08190 [bacterium]
MGTVGATVGIVVTTVGIVVTGVVDESNDSVSNVVVLIPPPPKRSEVTVGVTGVAAGIGSVRGNIGIVGAGTVKLMIIESAGVIVGVSAVGIKDVIVRPAAVTTGGVKAGAGAAATGTAAIL